MPRPPQAPDHPAGYVVEAKTGGYFVKSRSQEGVYWLVFDRSCSCPAGQNNRAVCFHRTQVARFVKAINEAKKRPRAIDTGEAVVSRFVD